ncbi:MAG: hypothetical protein ACOX1P_14035 [Thermoguttaceae bacterium]|jgi:hypothetical protein
MSPIGLVLGLALAVAQSEPVAAGREPLIDTQGNVTFEGRRIILDTDSYPRRAGRIIEGPTIRREGEELRIGFALDRPDDVLVRIVDAGGKAVRTLACGVLGPNAPEPFQKDTLQQTIRWDGKDRDGKAAPAECRVQVAVGLSPCFDRFVGHNPGQLLSRIAWLEVDPQGRLYVQLATGRKADRTILRFDREGNYLDMVYPSNPETLASLGKKIEEVWPFVAWYEGEAIPHRPRSWPSFSPYSADPMIPYPMRITSEGDVYFAESTTGYPRWASKGELFRLFKTHVDRFWFLEMTPLMYSMGPFAIDEEGCGYIVTSTAEYCTGTYPPTLQSLSDPKAPGTIRKVNLHSGGLQADFEYNGTEPLAAKSAYLGVTQTVPAAKKTDRSKPDPTCDDAQRFCDLIDLAVDRAGRILAVDGWPRRVKVYERNGRFLGELSGLEVGGGRREFRDLRGIARAEAGFYLLGVFRDEVERAFLAKCAGDPLRPKVVWLAELDAGARHLAVDRTASPVLVWAGTGHGPASLSRIADLGDRVGEIRGIGGVESRTFRYPWNLAADAAGYLYIHDRDRESLIRTNDSLTEWKEVPLRGAPVSMLVDERNQRLLLSYSLGENGAYSKERLDEPGFLCFDLRTLDRLPFRLDPVYGREELAKRDRLFAGRAAAYYPWTKTYGGTLVGMDPAGNLYVRDAARGQSWHKATPSAKEPCAGVIRKYAPNGTIADEAYCRLFNTGGGATMDSHGCFYAVELPRVRWHTVVHDFQAALSHKSVDQVPVPRRGESPIRTQSGFTHLVKLAAAGGARNTDAELWAHRGVSCTNGGGCYCDWPDMHTAVDAADRIFVADIDLHMVKVLDTAGNMIARIGRWGNAETRPHPGGSARQIGFRLIYCVAAAGDSLFVSDKDLRRIAKIRMDYRQTEQAPVAQTSSGLR